MMLPETCAAIQRKPDGFIPSRSKQNHPRRAIWHLRQNDSPRFSDAGNLSDEHQIEKLSEDK